MRDDTPQNRPLIEPLDEHNRGLLEQVRPPDWQNPTPKDRYHLVVVGAGAAGLVSAVGSAGLGAKVAIVERQLLGGDCLNVGCVPSKAVIRAARAWHDARVGAEFGAPEVGAARGDFAVAMERMRRIRARISPIDGGIIVAMGKSRDAMQAIVEDDPFVRKGLADYRIVEFRASQRAPDLPGRIE